MFYALEILTIRALYKFYCYIVLYKFYSKHKKHNNISSYELLPT